MTASRMGSGSGAVGTMRKYFRATQLFVTSAEYVSVIELLRSVQKRRSALTCKVCGTPAGAFASIQIFPSVLFVTTSDCAKAVAQSAACTRRYFSEECISNCFYFGAG